MTEQSNSIFTIDGPGSLEPSPPMPHTIGDIGAKLSEAREDLGRSIDQLADDLRIRSEYLSALEENRFERIPGLPYAAGFLRSYAAALELDPEPLVDQFKREMGDPREKKIVELHEPEPEPRVSGFAMIVLVLALIGVLYGGWRVLASQDAAERDAAAAPAQSTRQGEAPASDTGGMSARANVIDAALVQRQDADAANGSMASELRDEPVSMSLPADSEDIATANPDDSDADGASAGQTGYQTNIVLFARADTWLRVRDGNGDTVVARVLRPGDTYQVPDRNDLVATVGNAGGIDVVINGRTLEPLGPSGVPVHGVSLARSSLTERP